DCLMLQEAIKKADHLVIVYPVWWGTYPSLLKGMIDRAFLPGFMFKFHPNGYSWDKFMKGKSARLIVTMNSPKWYYKFIVGRPGDRSMKRSVLGFAGFRPVRITHLGPLKNSDPDQRQKWLNKIETLGKRIK
ncbi:MAG: NAD(P)H-dependent oxidoreductase, partial [FCB group bacterium]|nr:NAD(P)H-dependent oxidoreductase [FCB group bacterium]